jgi:hypothetical protein
VFPKIPRVWNRSVNFDFFNEYKAQLSFLNKATLFVSREMEAINRSRNGGKKSDKKKNQIEKDSKS